MLKTFLASTAIAGMMIATAHAQDATDDPLVPAPEGGIEAPAPGLETTPDVDPLAPPAGGMDGMDDAFVEESWSPVGIETVSADQLIGADIRSNMDDSQIGSVGDVILAGDGAVEGIVAQFGGFLGFGRDRVLVGADDVEIFQDADGNTLVRTSLTREALEGMPEYEG